MHTDPKFPRKEKKNASAVKEGKHCAEHDGGYAGVWCDNGAKEIRNTRESSDPQENKTDCNTGNNDRDDHLEKLFNFHARQ